MDDFSFLAGIEKYLNQPINPDILSDEECEKIIMAFAKCRGKTGFTEDEVYKLLKWCEGVRIGDSMVNLIIEGLAEVDLNEEGEPLFRITPDGIAVVDSLFEGEDRGLIN